MKTKIFALIVAILCFSVLFAACSNETCEEHIDEDGDAFCDVCDAEIESDEESTTKETEAAPCEEHKDEDANKLCDACGAALVYISEQVKPETETKVPTVVNPIPEDANIADYIDLDFKEEVIKSFDRIDGTEYTGFSNVYSAEHGIEVRLVSQGELDSDDYYVVWDTANREKLIDKIYKKQNVQTSIVFYDDYFEVRNVADESASFANYTYSGDLIGAKLEWRASKGSVQDFILENVLLTKIATETYDVIYLKDHDGSVYTIDAEDDKLMDFGEMREDTLIARPDFDHEQNNIGYVVENGKVYAYDLTKWIDCIYSYEIPGYFEQSDAFVLANGDLLIQGIVTLADDAVSYDIVLEGKKIDIRYVLVDISELNAKSVEFGHIIGGVVPKQDDDGYTDKVQNLFMVICLENQRVDLNGMKYLVVDNDLTVKAELTDYMDQGSELIADGLVLTHTVYGNTSVDLRVIKDLTGESKDVRIPYGATVYGTYIVYEDEVYDLGMKNLGAGKADGYNTYFRGEDYMLLYKITDEGWVQYYFFNPSRNRSPVALADGITMGSTYECFFEISYTEGSGADSKRVYEIFNSQNKSLNVSDWSVWNVAPLEESGWVIYLNNGENYIGK